MSIVIGVDPDGLRNVAKKCAEIQSALAHQKSLLNKLPIELHHAIRGNAAMPIEEHFKLWCMQLEKLIHELGVVSTSLNRVAILADEQIEEIQDILN